MVTCTGHIGIHEGADGHTDVPDVMAIKPNFATSMGYHLVLTMVLRARGAPLLNCGYEIKCYQEIKCQVLTVVYFHGHQPALRVHRLTPLKS